MTKPLPIPNATAAFTAIMRAGHAIDYNFRNPANTMKLKADGSPVTDVDEQIHQELLEWAISQNIGYVGEEGNGDTDNDVILYVDPLDGTSSFNAGIATVTIAASMMVRVTDDRYAPAYSIILEPLTGWAWYTVGTGTTFVTKTSCLENFTTTTVNLNPTQGLVTSIFPPGPLRDLRTVRDAINDMQPEMKHQSCGSLALCGGLIASGSLHGLLFGGTSAAEACAMLPIVHGAGAVTSDLSGRPLDSFELGVNKGKIDFLLPDGLIIATDSELWRTLFTLVEQTRANIAA